MPEMPKLRRGDAAGRHARVAAGRCFFVADGEWFGDQHSGQFVASIERRSDQAVGFQRACHAKGTPPPLPKRIGGSSSNISSSSGIGVPQGASAMQSAARAAGPWAPESDRGWQPPGEMAGAADGAGAKQSAASVALALLGQHRWWIVGSAAGMIAAALITWIAARALHSTPPTDPASIVEPTIPAASLEDPIADQGPTAQAAATAERAPSATASKSSTAPSAVSKPAVAAGAADGQAEKGDRAPEPSAIKAPAPAPTAQANDSASGSATAAAAGPAKTEPAVPTADPSEKPSASPGLPATPVATTDEDSQPAVPFDPAKQAELMSHLQDKLPALEFTGVPLGQFVSFLSLASTVPMSIDSQSLAAVGKSTKTRITVKLDDATVEQALKAALEKPGLAYHIEPGRLVVSRAARKSK